MSPSPTAPPPQDGTATEGPPIPAAFGLTRAQAERHDTPGNGVLPAFLILGAAQGALLLPLVADDPLIDGAIAGFVVAAFLTPALWLALLPARIPVWRDRRRYRAARIAFWGTAFEADLLSRKGIAFEDRLGELLSRTGYRAVQITERIGERLIDITARRGRRRVAFQCTVRATEIGEHEVAALHSAVLDGRFHRGVVVAPGGWSPDAEQLAAGKPVALWGQKELRALVRRAEQAGETLHYPGLAAPPRGVDAEPSDTAARAGSHDAARAVAADAAATSASSP